MFHCLVFSLIPSCWNLRLLFLFFSISAIKNRLFLMGTYRNRTDGNFAFCYPPFRRGINSDSSLYREETCFFSGSNRSWQKAGLLQTACCGKKKVRKSLELCRSLQVEENLSCWEEIGSRRKFSEMLQRESRKLGFIFCVLVTEQDGSKEAVTWET